MSLKGTHNFIVTALGHSVKWPEGKTLYLQSSCDLLLNERLLCLMQALTMFYALRELGNVQEGHTVLIHSAAGGCGTFALGICKQLKAKVIATVGTHDKVMSLMHLVIYSPDYFSGFSFVV
jgi:NADPH-dependent curcumin reductase CurA